MRKSNEYLPNHVEIYWHTDDIKSRDDKDLLSERDCREILDSIKRTHDASIGVNWEVIDSHIEKFLAERKFEKSMQWSITDNV